MNRLWLAAVGIVCLAIPAIAGAETRALLIAIEKYEHLPVLKGPSRDVTEFRKMLVRVCGVKGSSITELRDGHATRAGVQSALESLAAESRRGDLALIYFSGHGTQVPDRNRDENDGSGENGRDEALICADYRADEHGNAQLLLDDDIKEYLDAIISTGARILYIVDACHSGTSERASSLETVKRFAEVPKELVIEMGGWPDPAPKRNPSKIAHVTPGLTVIAACEDRQNAYSAKFPQGWMGVLTKSIIEVISERGGLRYADLGPELERRIAKSFGKQKPSVAACDSKACFMDMKLGKPAAVAAPKSPKRAGSTSKRR